MNVSIIIPIRNEENYIRDTIYSVLNQDYDQGCIEILVVDGESNDNTKSIVGDLMIDNSTVRLINNPNKTTPHALNIGLKNASNEIIIRVDGHAKIAKEFVRLSVNSLFENEEIMCAGGAIINIYTNEWSKIIGHVMQSKFGVGNSTFRTGGKKQYVDTVAFGAYKREVFNSIGFFDEELIRNQDDELNYRIIQNGYKILFNPAIQSEYYVRSSLTKLYRQYFQYGYWKVYVSKKHKNITSARQIIPFLFVLGLIIGLAVSLIFPALFLIYSSVLILYFIFSMFFSVKLCTTAKEIPKYILTFFIIHWSYGWGYLAGFLDFILLRKKPSEKNKELSR